MPVPPTFLNGGRYWDRWVPASDAQGRLKGSLGGDIRLTHYDALTLALAPANHQGERLAEARKGSTSILSARAGSGTIRTCWHLKVNYVHADSRSDTEPLPAELSAWFPEDCAGLDTLTLDSTYLWTPALTLHLRYRLVRYGSSEWARVYGERILQLLVLAAQPYRYDVDEFGLSVVYWLGD
jgi:Putative outer membrane beta-barrel porin, MtrB/PioB